MGSIALISLAGTDVRGWVAQYLRLANLVVGAAVELVSVGNRCRSDLEFDSDHLRH